MHHTHTHALGGGGGGMCNAPQSKVSKTNTGQEKKNHCDLL